jgi:glutamyl-tRNA reductase
MAAGRDVIVALVTHARRVPVAERERFAARLREDPHGPSLVVETCHRVEAYVVQPDGEPSPADLLPAGGRLLVGEAAIRHAIAVAVGRDSVVVGEDQILHQVRTSVDSAREGGGLQPVLERLFALGLRAGRRARSWRVGPGRSLADVAISAIERQTGPLSGRQVLVVGAGKMGRLAVRSALAAGASVSVANRSPGRAIPLLSETGAGTEAFDPGPSIARFSAVIVALAGPWPIARATIDSLAASSAVVVDLSVPAAMPSASIRALGARLVTADDLAAGDASPLADDDRSLARLDALIAETTAEFCAWLELRDGRAAAAALAARADRERHAELDLLWRRLPDLDADAHDAIERMSRHLARRILREPLERLGRDADGRHERAVRELFGL